MPLLLHRENPKFKRRLREIQEGLNPPLMMRQDLETCEQLWGTDIMQKIGCKILPQLLKKDVYLQNEQLSILEQDCSLILNSLDLVSQKTSFATSYIAFRVNNILEVLSTFKQP